MASWLIATGMGSAPSTLTVDAPAVHGADATVEVALALHAHGRVTAVALQAVIEYDRQRLHFESATVGPASVKAQKELSVNGTAPDQVSLIVFGLNRNVVGEGLVASLRFQLVSPTRPGTIPIRFSKVSATNPQGQPIALQAIPGRIVVLK